MEWPTKQIGNLIIGGLFFIELVVLIIQITKFFIWKKKKLVINKLATHICMSLAVICSILNAGSTISWNLNPSPVLTMHSFCFIPGVFNWYFLFSGYGLCLYNWTKAYNSIKKKHSLVPFRIFFISLNIVTFLLSCTTGSMYCYQSSTSAAANGIFTSVANILYVLTLTLNALVMSLGFTIYGAKIAWNLRDARGMKLDKTQKRDYYIFKVTCQTLVLSATCFVGLLIAVVTDALGNISTSAIQAAFQLIMIAEVIYVARPRKGKPKQISHTDSESGLRTTTSTDSDYINLKSISSNSSV